MSRVFTSLLAVLLGVAVCGQGYAPMTTPGSRWLQHVYSPFGDQYLYSVDLAGDTMIDGFSYTLVEGMIPGALRDEGGRVWFQPAYTDELAAYVDSFPLLLYDFNLMVGDSFPLPAENNIWAHVNSRDSIMMMDGSFRDRIQFAPVSGIVNARFSGTWVEGVGDAEFVFNGIWTAWEVGVWLECYGVDNDPLFGSCLFLGANQIARAEPFSILQNLDEGSVLIKGPVEGIREIKVLNSSGQLLREQSGPRSVVDLTGLPDGTYMLILRSVNGDQLFRVVNSPGS